MIPNKKKVTQQRGRAIFKTDRMISQIKYEIRQEKKEREKRDGKSEEATIPEKKDETKDSRPIPQAPVKKTGPKTLDADAVKELYGQLRKRLKIPEERQLTWSYLEYNCVYHGVRLNELQKKALREYIGKLAQEAPVQ